VKSTGAETIGRGQRELYAYHDGELSGLQRWIFERRLARSPGLRAELDALRQLTHCVQDLGPQPPSLDVWDEVARRLPAIDAERAGQRHELDRQPQRQDAQPRSGAGRQKRGAEPRGWRGMDWLGDYSRPLAAVAVSAALALALFLGIMEDGAPPIAGIMTPGTIRWLDTGGRSVIVLEDQDDATIVWLLDALEDGTSEGGSREAV
jgi:anti-sigma factor RsiW